MGELTTKQSSIWESDAEAWICPVTCRGDLTPIVLEFANRFPENVEAYLTQCKAKHAFTVGDVLITQTPRNTYCPRWIIFFPVRIDLNSNSTELVIRIGIQNLLQLVDELGAQGPRITRLAFPNMEEHSGIPQAAIQLIMQQFMEFFPGLSIDYHAPIPREE